jgi:hypothetical protein
MNLTLVEIKAINELAEHLYGYLPGKAHPYADQEISFQGIAHRLGLGNFWSGGSKKSAIGKLLESTLKYRKEAFCSLILAVVEKTMAYNNRNHPFSKEDIQELNHLVFALGFKIPELWDSKFISQLPSFQAPAVGKENKVDFSLFKNRLFDLTSLDAINRGFAFEKFLNEFFGANNLIPRESFRIVGEQIDGSFQLDAETYLLEAKWQKESINEGDLLIFEGKVRSKSNWSRGLFVSYGSFSEDALHAFSRGKSTSIVGMTSQDLFLIFENEMLLADAIRYKIRWAAETGEFFKSVFELQNIY